MKLYRNDTIEQAKARSRHYLDLYLNSPEKGVRKKKKTNKKVFFYFLLKILFLFQKKTTTTTAKRNTASLCNQIWLVRGGPFAHVL
jgi:hypothetical protein